MNITITGTLGAGKSTVCKELEKKNMEVITAGSIFRGLANEMGITVTELNKVAESDPAIDHKIDSRTSRLGKEKEDALFDCRMGWHFVDESFKVFLFSDLNEAARRVYTDNSRKAESYNSVDEARASILKRSELEIHRFKEFYSVNYYDMSNYNLIIETTHATPIQIASEVIRNYELYKKEQWKTKIEIDIRSLLPTQAFRDISPVTFAEYMHKEQKSNGLCVCDEGDKPIITSKNGMFYIVDGHHRVFGGAACGKVFCNIPGVDTSIDLFLPPFDKDYQMKLYDYEELGKFRYNMDYFYNKPLYNIDFSCNHFVQSKEIVNSGKNNKPSLINALNAKIDQANSSQESGHTPEHNKDDHLL